jgi:hypothetical protein
MQDPLETFEDELVEHLFGDGVVGVLHLVVLEDSDHLASYVT